MMKKIYKFQLPSMQEIELALEDTMRVYSLINQLKSLNYLEADSNYSVKTITDIDVPAEGTFNRYNIDQFIIFEDNDLETEQETDADEIIITTSGPRVGSIKPPMTFHQLGILVLDGSGSMEDMTRMNLTKAQSVHMAVKELLGRLKAGRMEENFSFAITMFGNDVEEHTKISSLKSIDDNQDFNPLIVDGSDTKIYLGLIEAQKYAESFLKNAPDNSVDHSVIILLMSDGISHDPVKCISVAKELKNNKDIQIACAYFGTLGANDTAAQDLLQQISSGPNFYKTTYGAEDLRKFFEASISQSVGIKF